MRAGVSGMMERGIATRMGMWSQLEDAEGETERIEQPEQSEHGSEPPTKRPRLGDNGDGRTLGCSGRTKRDQAYRMKKVPRGQTIWNCV
jgi:hypothetical protein